MIQAPRRRGRDILLSVISHGQGEMVARLLDDLDRLPAAERLQVLVTINIPEPRPQKKKYSFPLRFIENRSRSGFARNHNRAFHQPLLPDEHRYFLVVNPDVRLPEDAITPMAAALEADPEAGLIAPRVIDPDNTEQDSARVLPTPAGLLAKLLGDRRGQWQEDAGAPLTRPDWVAGMFMLFRAEVFARVNGFDERYFLYYEDVDICSRIWLDGSSVLAAQRPFIVHDAQRQSWRSFAYLRWHLLSMQRFLCSKVYRRARVLHSARRNSK